MDQELRSLLAGHLTNQRLQRVAEIPHDVVLGVYFSASWCPPCRQFTPLLKRYYEEANRLGKRLEIVFVSSDHTEFDFVNYYQQHHGPWIAVPFQNAQLRERLGARFGVRGIPAFFIESQEARGAVTSGDLSLIDRFVQPQIPADARDLLIRVAENIVRNISQEKFKVLKKSSEKLKDAVLSKPQGTQLLINLGFADEGDSFRFTGSIDGLIRQMEILKAMTPAPHTAAADEPEGGEVNLEIHTLTGKSEISLPLEDFEVFKALVASAVDLSCPVLLAETSAGTLPLQSSEDLATLGVFARKTKSSALKVYALQFSEENRFVSDEEAQENSRSLLSKLDSISSPELSRYVNLFPVILLYEVPSIQRKALMQIPIGKLFPGETSELEFIAALVRWFKGELFKWTDKPRCMACNGTTEHSGSSAPSAQERNVGMASRVEMYVCTVCGMSTRFPRYNHPGILLETRTGRCGEFSSAFALFCHALGFDTRKVFPIDGDHVWVEVYLDSLQRWIHVDPCEAAVDQPLLYEAGWSRKYSRVVAVSRRECVDVTRRYVVDFASKPVFDQKDLDQIDGAVSAFYLNTRTQNYEQIKKWLAERREAEDQEVVRAAKSSETQRRTTGSLEWRADRGELGKN